MQKCADREAGLCLLKGLGCYWDNKKEGLWGFRGIASSPPPPSPLKYKTFAPTFTSLPPNLLIRFLTVKNIFFFCRNQNAFFSTFESIKKKNCWKILERIRKGGGRFALLQEAAEQT